MNKIKIYKYINNFILFKYKKKFKDNICIYIHFKIKVLKYFNLSLFFNINLFVAYWAFLVLKEPAFNAFRMVCVVTTELSYLFFRLVFILTNSAIIMIHIRLVSDFRNTFDFFFLQSFMNVSNLILQLN